MKTIIQLLALVALMITSCKKDDELQADRTGQGYKIYSHIEDSTQNGFALLESKNDVDFSMSLTLLDLPDAPTKHLVYVISGSLRTPGIDTLLIDSLPTFSAVNNYLLIKQFSYFPVNEERVVPEWTVALNRANAFIKVVRSANDDEVIASGNIFSVGNFVLIP